MGGTSIELWMDQHQYKALERILTECGTNVETVMQARLMEFYRQTVPEQERVDINNRIEAARLADERRTQEMRSFTVYHIAENGSECYFESDYGMEFMQTARQIRKYLRAEFKNQPKNFAAIFNAAIPIDAQRFSERVSEFLDDSKNIVCVFDIDFDKQEFSSIHRLNGWTTFPMKDVSIAAYYAYRKDYQSMKDRWGIFIDHLDGKQITASTTRETDGNRRLTKDDVSFSDEIIESDGKLNFYMDTVFDVDQVFGTHVETPDNGDWLNIYANYDTEQRQVCDTLDVVLHRNDGSDEELSYTLSAAEKEILLGKMDAYCLEREGVMLDAYCAQLIAEEQGTLMEPQM